MPLTPKREPRPDTVSHYDALLRAAIRLTGGRRRDEAEELVQEAFVRFIEARPRLPEVDNPDGYLYTVMRNLRVSHTRHSMRVQQGPLSLVEGGQRDRARLSSNVAGWLDARHALRAACRYGCWRKGSSKSGSLFLLRFVHGYEPREIARLAQTTERAVDEWLRLARHELKRHLANPERLRRLAAPIEPAVPAESEPAPALELIQELRCTVFRWRHECCFSDAELDRWYGPDRLLPVGTLNLSALVSCPDCLARVDDRLSLTPASDRYPPDTIGRNARASSDASGTRATRRATVALVLAVAFTGTVLARPSWGVSAIDWMRRVVVSFAGAPAESETGSIPSRTSRGTDIRLPVAPPRRVRTTLRRAEAGRPMGAVLSVLDRLYEVDAYLGQEVTQVRTLRDRARISVVVDSDARRRDIAAAVASLPADAAELDIDIIDASAAGGRGERPAVPRVLRDYAVPAGEPPAFAGLRALVESTRPPDAATDPEVAREVQRLANRVLDLSLRASQHAAALAQLARDFGPPAFGTLERPGRARLVRLITRHAVRFEEEHEALRRQLMPVIARATDAPTPGDTHGEFLQVTDPWDAIARLKAADSHRYELLRASFALSAGGSDAPAIDWIAIATAIHQCAGRARALQMIPWPAPGDGR